MKLEFDEEEKKRIDAFYQKHKDCKLTSTIGGKIMYEITPTGLGPIIAIRCNSCNGVEDITEYEKW